jgi:hypothetical protein
MVVLDEAAAAELPSVVVVPDEDEAPVPTFWRFWKTPSMMGFPDAIADAKRASKGKDTWGAKCILGVKRWCVVGCGLSQELSNTRC